MSKRLCGVLIVLGLALGAPRVRCEDKPKDAPELRVLDVSDLTTPNTDYPSASGYLLGLQANGGGIVDPFASQPIQENLTDNDLVTLIHDRLMPGEFADPSSSIGENNQHLIIMQRKPVLQRIEQYLAELRRTQLRQLAVKGLLLAAAEVPAATQFSSEELSKLVGPHGISDALAAPRIVCFNRQTVHVQSGRVFSFIKDYDAAGSIYAPLIGSALDGHVLEVHPTLSSDETVADVTVEFTYSRRGEKTETRNIVLAMPVVDADAKAAEAHGRARPAVLPMDMPSLSFQHISTSVRAPLSKWMLAGVMNNPNPGPKEKRLLFFIRVDALNPSDTPAK